MNKSSKIELDFIIDKLTNSVENIQTGDSFPTEISLLNASELKSIGKKNGWNFNWKMNSKNLKRIFIN